MSAFNDLRRVMRDRLELLTRRAKSSKDPQQLEAIHRQKQVIHTLWLDFLRMHPEGENPISNEKDRRGS